MLEWCKHHWLITAIIVSVIILWIMGLTTFVTFMVFTAPVKIPTGTATAFATFFALPPLIVKLMSAWFERQAKREKLKHDSNKTKD